jgi:kinesin family protein C2/C3
MSKKFISSAVSAPDLNSPMTVLSGLAPQSFAVQPNGGNSAAAAASLLPPIQTMASGDDDGRVSFAGSRMDASAASESKGPSLGGYIGNVGAASSAPGRPPLVGAGQSMSSSNAGVVHSMAGSSNALLSDAAIKRIEAEGEADDAALLFHLSTSSPIKGGANDNINNKSLLPQTSAVGTATAAPTNQAVSPSIKIDHHHHPQHQHTNHHGTTGEHVAEEGTVVSSLTQGFDQEIVEELHQALTELRAELEASRAEAARAVKVAEQAIQSAESCSSSDWNSTVTHKAAEAAAQAQKKSAEALAKQRLAEEKLASERKSAQYWRQQAEAAEQEAGLLTTRAVVAEVKKAEVETTLESERRKNAAYISSLKENYESSDEVRKAALADAAERNRLLEIELNGTRTDLASRSEEAKMLQDTLSEVTSIGSKGGKGKKMSFGMGRKKGHARGNSLLSGDASSVLSGAEIMLSPSDNLSNGQLTQLHADATSMRHQLEVLRRTTIDELSALPEFAREWVGRAAAAVEASQTEARVLQEKLAMESSMRRKLLNEIQDMKGNVRVYCRPQPRGDGATIDITSVPSSNVIVLHRDHEQDADNDFGSPAPMSFEFDRVFSPGSDQKEIYSEVEELALGALDGFNICLMAYGTDDAGKSRTIMCDYKISLDDPEAPTATIVHQGIHFMAAQQLFTVAEHRADRYQDCFTINIVEVHDDKLRDLLAGTPIAEESGQVSPPKSRNKKSRGADDGSASASKTGGGKDAGTRLEIRTNYDGDTVVQGAITVEVKSFSDLCRVWQECLIGRSARLAEQGINEDQYLAECHVIATLSVVSTNVSTGLGTSGRIQFVDLASSDLKACYIESDADADAIETINTPSDSVLSGVGNNSQWKYANKSLETLLDVVTARSQFSRSVPYRNSTLTHLLRDSFTSDTKFLFITSVSTDAEDLQNTASALRFASLMRKVNVGIATKHTVSLA